ncbi:UDP binding domain-containing protein, partial [Acinetobacter baumannii]|uniref:UDP binding domain-containing protein n=1 Tax=Acinetobacter baumannii TaxID=470 RepID=UPI0028918362
KVIDMIKERKDYQMDVDVDDPWIDSEEAQQEYGITPVKQPTAGQYDAVILAVAHNEFKEMGIEAIRSLGKASYVLYD